ncbi:MAG: L,D-transpeptidase family protein [Candidatus Eremiobacteraeota bacterium]|nr:L,D-transpeptidase family protein [Candidatus Eremiobacteraeota bacterium]
MILLTVLILDHLLTRAGSPPICFSLLAIPCAAMLDWRRTRHRKLRAGYVLLYCYLLFGLLPWPQAPMTDAAVVIHKERRELLYQGKSMRIGLGNHPQGSKEEEGDGKTPEGFYRICSKASDSPFGHWLGLDYPNRRDAWNGRLHGKVSWLELTRWNWFWRSEPPQTTRLGGQIGIHGGGSGKAWTLGCIALDELDIKELFQGLPFGAVVEVR